MNTYPSLFAPPPRRKRGLVLTLIASLLVHGSLIGVAAFWPVREVLPGVNVTIIDGQPPEFFEEKSALPPESIPSVPDPVQPEMKVTEPADTAPPPVEPDADPMQLSTPRPPSVARATTRATSAPTTARAVRAPGAQPSTGGPAASAGAGSTGARLRWNTPRPVYPVAQRLARVQGNGVVRVTTDGTGRVVDAVIVQSTGNAVLDDNTCRSARSFWSGPPNAMVAVPITYRLP